MKGLIGQIRRTKGVVLLITPVKDTPFQPVDANRSATYRRRIVGIEGAEGFRSEWFITDGQIRPHHLLDRAWEQLSTDTSNYVFASNPLFFNHDTWRQQGVIVEHAARIGGYGYAIDLGRLSTFSKKQFFLVPILPTSALRGMGLEIPRLGVTQLIALGDLSANIERGITWAVFILDMQQTGQFYSGDFSLSGIPPTQLRSFYQLVLPIVAEERGTLVRCSDALYKGPFFVLCCISVLDIRRQKEAGAAQVDVILSPHYWTLIVRSVCPQALPSQPLYASLYHFASAALGFEFETN